MIREHYTVGQQPCENFNPTELGDWGGPMVHSCPICYGCRVWCDTCSRDHHKGGWETCTEAAREENSQ